MYSQCPECQTRFRVTAAALRAARGTVRCGRCGSAFDALQRLSDALPDEPDLARDRGLAPVSTLVPSDFGANAVDREPLDEDGDGSVVTEFHFSPDDLDQVFIDVRDWQRQFGDGTEPPESNGRTRPDHRTRSEPVGAGAEATGGTPADVYVHEPESVEDITLEGERIVIEAPIDMDGDVDADIDVDLDDARQDVPYDGRDDAVRLEGTGVTTEPPVDLDSTGRFAALRDVPQSKYPVLADEDEHTAAPRHTPEPALPEPPDLTETPTSAAAPADTTAIATPADVEIILASTETTVVPAPVRVTPAPAPTPTPADEPIRPFRLRDRPADLDVADDLDEQAGGHKALWWGFGALLLALVLVAQLAHHYRDVLARDATVGPTVRSIYAQLGRPLPPQWDLAAFELRQWGATDNAAPTTPGAMAVRASLRNGADFAQPMPLLRLELEDRFGGTVGQRDFAPAEYLKDAAQAGRLLSAGATTEAALELVDVSSDAVGYRLDVCLRDDETLLVRCAQSATRPGQPK